MAVAEEVAALAFASVPIGGRGNPKRLLTAKKYISDYQLKSTTASKPYGRRSYSFRIHPVTGVSSTSLFCSGLWFRRIQSLMVDQVSWRRVDSVVTVDDRDSVCDVIAVAFVVVFTW